MKAVLLGYARLARPANLPTAAADILAGAALSGSVAQIISSAEWDFQIVIGIFLLVLSSVLLYAGGVVLNDVFDVAIDKVERPERPIPSGLVSARSAAVFGIVLLLAGIVIAFLRNDLSGTIAIILALAIVLYDSFSKRYGFLGPLNMGLCRALNLILGMSVLGSIDNYWYGVIPLVYIFAITLISRGEVHGDNRKHIIWAGILYAGVIFGVLYLVPAIGDHLWWKLAFLLIFVVAIYTPLIRAYKNNSPGNIKKAVIAGVLSLVILDATMAVGVSFWWYGLLVLLLLPLSMILSKIFAVT